VVVAVTSGLEVVMMLVLVVVAVAIGPEEVWVLVVVAGTGGTASTVPDFRVEASAASACGAEAFALAEGINPTSMVLVRASWSLPPLPKFALEITALAPTLLKMLSMPPSIVPAKTWKRRVRSSEIVSEAPLALKSPDRTMASPG